MGREGFEILIIRKSGPTQSMNVKGWWITFILAVVLLFGAALGAGAYMLYRQYWVMSEIAEDTRLLMFRTERLEALVQEQETKELMISQQQNQPSVQAPQQQTADPAEPPQPLPDEPASSELLSIQNIHQGEQSGNLLISFDIVNEQGSEPALGYITVIAHGQRQGKPWIEAWPPMRLNQQGRPEQYRRGTPFSVQRFRTVRARMAIADKAFERLEFVFYSRQGDVMLVHSFPIQSQPPAITVEEQDQAEQ